MWLKFISTSFKTVSKNIILVKHQNTYQIIIGLFLISITKKMKIIILKSYITRLYMN